MCEMRSFEIDSVNGANMTSLLILQDIHLKRMPLKVFMYVPRHRNVLTRLLILAHEKTALRLIAINCLSITDRIKWVNNNRCPM